MRLGDLDCLKERMCSLCNEDYSDEPCEPSDCAFMRAINETPTVKKMNESLTVDRVVNEYLRICCDDCAGDDSVGIPACPFYKFPDEDTVKLITPDRCELKEYIGSSEE